MIIHKNIDLLTPPQMREILRYMGCATVDDTTEELIRSCLAESENIFSCKIVYSELPITIQDRSVMLDKTEFVSQDLKKCLFGSDRAMIFAATVGLGIDRLIMKYSRINPSRALCMQAIGAERIEALCNAFCLEINKELKLLGRIASPRFSPGYGDLSLEYQRDIFRLLDSERRIGLTLNDSLLMSPTKSVTAIIGIKIIGENENT